VYFIVIYSRLLVHIATGVFILKTIPLNHLRIQTPEKPLASIILHYLMVLFMCWAITAILSPLWALKTNIIHTGVELICIFIALAAFFVVWHTYDRTSPVNHLVGFGFLMVAVFDLCHAYFFPEFNLYPPGFYDLSTRYWILGRLAEALVLLFTAFKLFQININKWLGGLTTLALTTGVSVLAFSQPGLLPVLFLPESGITPAKIALEYLITALFLAGAYIMFRRLNNREHLTYRYIFLALLLAIPAEMCFTVFKTLTDFYKILGHVLKITYYYYLFRGIFVSAVTLPHAKLETAGRYMTEILNSIPVGILTYDNNLKATFANRKAEEILNSRVEDIRGKTAGQMFAQYVRNDEISEPLASQVLAGDARPIINKLLNIENGCNNLLKTIVNAHRLENGGAIIRLSEARREQELENLQLQTQTVLDSIQDMALLLDRNSRIIMCNKILEKELQMNAEELLGLDIDGFLAMTRFNGEGMGMENPGESCFETTITGADGQTREVVFRTAPICNVDDEIIGYICTCADMTGFKKEQQRIRQREKLALLGQMAAGIVHEIKNPLTAINGFNQLIMIKTTDEKIKEYADIIQNEVVTLNKVVTDFLSFAKPRPPVFKEIIINNLIASLQKMLETQMFINGIKADFHLDKDEVPVWADDNQLKQVIMNIFKNAIEATQETTNPRLNICTHYNKVTQEMSISISDNGKGISPEEQSKLGTPFYTTKDKGTGLGLSVCYQMVKEHGGSISLVSEINKGTTFTISLPAKNIKGRITA